MKITLTHEEAKRIAFESEGVIEQEGHSWRWGTRTNYIFERDGKRFLFNLRFHVEDGCQDEGDVEAIEVEPVEVKSIVWRTVKEKHEQL